MISKDLIVSKHIWNGRGGPRGVATHVFDTTFYGIMKEIEAQGLGMYRITFGKVEDIPHKIHPSGQAEEYHAIT